MPLTVRAPAKINLYLRVFPVGHDGFHPLRSWFRTIDLSDELTVRKLRERPEPTASGFAENVELHSSHGGLPAGSANLIIKAWQTMSVVVGDEPEWVGVDLDKRIPIGAGLGGGSSNAAAALIAYQWARKQANISVASDQELQSAAESVGADVPFFLRHQLDGITDATCTGRGDIVQPFTPGRRHAVLLILPDLQVSTPAVYARFDELPAPPDDDAPDFAGWSHLPTLELLPKLRNDLEAPAFSLHTQLSRLREHMEAQLGRPVRMSGSGSALFTLYDDRADAAAQVTNGGLPFRLTLA